MTESPMNEVEQFLRNLESSLNVSKSQARDIVEEVRSDLWSRVEDLKREGKDEAEAVAGTLREMGNPYEISHRIGREVVPQAATMIRCVRILAAGAVFTLRRTSAV